MRRRLRDLESDLRKAGFSRLSHRGKGSHELWLHPTTGAKVLLPRPKGDLLPDYVDKQVQKAIRESRNEYENEHAVEGKQMSSSEPEAFVASIEDWTPEEWARAERYTFTVGWSAEDKMFIASAVEIPYAMSYGRTPEEAVHNAVDAVASVIDAAADKPAIVIPEPSGVTV